MERPTSDKKTRQGARATMNSKTKRPEGGPYKRPKNPQGQSRQWQQLQQQDTGEQAHSLSRKGDPNIKKETIPKKQTPTKSRAGKKKRHQPEGAQTPPKNRRGCQWTRKYRARGSQVDQEGHKRQPQRRRTRSGATTPWNTKGREERAKTGKTISPHQAKNPTRKSPTAAKV
ncbi:hypothetical protein NDU88_007260 [Pleurodeles waltl]|uniref:Uncharacterized protein n=1 Tax=Pleurodeles waltl TaxID=8319 RepID=A0AAV7VS02_PLEWA|nr:hypothetical protein NDU88_007260 [Pleurodeles waltl]